MADQNPYQRPTQRGRHAQQSSSPAHQALPTNPVRPVTPMASGRATAADYNRSHYGHGSSSRKGKRGPWRVVFIIAIVVFVVSLIALGLIGFSYWQGQKAYDDVAASSFQAPADIEGTSLDDLVVDWDALRAINPDTVGWIYMPGTAINYPIVHTTDDQKYLTHDFQGSEGWIATFGAIFLSAANNPDFSDANNVIYGHHLNNGSMFADIAGLDDATRFNECRTVYILTPQGNYRLTSFSLVHTSAYDPIVQTTFTDAASRTAYVQDKIDRTCVAVDGNVPTAADVSRIFTFSTCDNLPSDGRYVLFCSVTESTVASAASASSGGSSVLSDQDFSAINDAAKEIA